MSEVIGGAVSRVDHDGHLATLSVRHVCGKAPDSGSFFRCVLELKPSLGPVSDEWAFGVVREVVGVSVAAEEAS